MSIFNNDKKDDQAIVAMVQALQASVTAIHGLLITIYGKVNTLMGIDTELQSEATAEAADIQALFAAVGQEITDFKAWLSAQPAIPPAVMTNLTTLLTNIQAAHASIVAQTATVKAADPGAPASPVVNT